MKFQKKSLGSLVLVLVLLLLAACGGQEESSPSGEEGGSAEKITIFQSKVEISDQLQALAKEYTDETGVEVEVLGTTGDDYFQQLQIRLNSNQGPSIFSLQHAMEAEKLKSYIADLSSEEYVKDIAPNMELKLEDKVVGIPYGVEGFGMIYNKDLVKPEDVKDLASFTSTLEKFKGQDINGFSLAQDAYFLIGHISNYPFSLQADPTDFISKLNAGEVTMAQTPEFQEFGQFMEAIKTNTPTPLSVSYDQQIGDFASGKTAMIHQGNWASGMLQEFDVDFEYGMLPFPLMGNDKLAVGTGNNWAINSQKEEGEIQAAKDFLNWMHTSDTGKRYIVEEFGFVPALTTIEPGDLDPLSQAVSEASNSGETIPWAQNAFPANIVPNNLTPFAQKFFSEDMNGEQFVEEFDKAWQSAQ
ncbi:carbohydrate ABC transporter substrate-binding protein (CUT1 family) [Planomicrobium soli]|uniref:Carbohydrate ABC transporter substrate-binding protein (CUT1 family) n=1 Tax=Planomicrobium soli TaxID=1176648 RepID=A0A2P8H5B2_9BACL|nr:extracellular solute-binding protein [Planomicrobium soli]PSL41412.1 carbohydrate ABC transporter substrate-binding protein (CUT1 family) [Planomicrobium soli]